MKLLPRRPRCSICGCLAFLILAVIVISVYFFAKKAGIRWQDIVNLLGQKAKIKIEQKTKKELKKEGKKLKGKVYQEATKHNPDGDLLPDEWDKKIKEEVKKRVE